MESAKEPRKISETITPTDIAALVRDKYDGDRDTDISADLLRLASGEPLAYVIGWIPFLDVKIHLQNSVSDSIQAADTSLVRPLIPRSETEWWTEKLIAHLKYKFEDKPFTLLDLCAGSGAIGLAVLHAMPNAKVSFGEINPELTVLIRKNLQENGLDEERVEIRTGDLLVPFAGQTFDILATNPPYIPEDRVSELAASVTDFEPHGALFAGFDGLSIITRILTEAPGHLAHGGELWMECDTSNIQEAADRAVATGKFEASIIHADQYGRLRFLTCESLVH